MKETPALEALKNALLLERRGKAFYTLAAREARDEAVRDLFQMLADEEQRHIQALSEQFPAVAAGRPLSFAAPGDGPQGQAPSVARRVLDADLRRRIASADFEAAAVSAAMAMEERALRLYAQRAEESGDPGEKALYRWLSQWESGHLEALAAIDRSLTEKVWSDNNFWPF
jgi:rubrerythrin